MVARLPLSARCARAARLSRRKILIGSAAASLGAPLIAHAQTEMGEVRIAKQYSIADLPLTVMQELGLIERHAEREGLKGLKTSWPRFAGGAPINDAMISGNLEFAVGGVGPMVTLWARTRGGLGVRGVAALNSIPLYLNTIRPEVATLRDLTPKDRIALPAVRVSIQAVTLQMACEQMFGPGEHSRLDPLTVSMSHPDAHNAMLSGRSEITAHFSSPPFGNLQLQNPRIHRLLSNYDVLGGPCSSTFIWTTQAVRERNPRVYRAVFAALEEAIAFIARHKGDAADLWLRAENSSLPREFALSLLNDPAFRFTTVPENTMKYAQFMHRTGTSRENPAGWQEMFFPEIHALQGS